MGIERVGDLRGYDLDEYYEIRSEDIAPATLEGEMWTLRMFCDFLEDLGAVDDLAEKVRVPDLDPEDRSNDTKLPTERAKALLRYYRNSGTGHGGDYGSRAHAFLELAWWTGARQGGLRALDLRNVELGSDPYVDFRYRPETDTPLKNKLGGERPVALTDEMAEVLRYYIRENRYDVHDEHGRQPLLASAQGRPASETLFAFGVISRRFHASTERAPTGRNRIPAGGPSTLTRVSTHRVGRRTRFEPAQSLTC